MKQSYGVKGLIEWQFDLETGYPVMPHITIKFEGGQITGYGIAPARYTTEDPFVMKLLEESEMYRSGKIFKLR